MASNTPSPFIHLRLHTAYSLCEGAVRIGELPKVCEALGMPAVAVTDTNNMFGVLEFSMKCASNRVQPIVGTLVDVHFENIVAPVVLLAQNEAGYKNLLKLMTCFYIENKHTKTNEKKSLTIENLQEHNFGVIALSGGATGPAGALFLQGSHEQAHDFLKSMHRVFADRFYMEISRHGIDAEKRTEDFFVEFAISNSIPLVATNDVFFVGKDMYEAQDILMCIADGAYVSAQDRRRLNAEYYLKTTQEMRTLFADIPEAIDNTAIVAKRCSFMPEARKPMLPKFDDGTGRHEDDILEFQANEGLKKRFVAKKGQEISDEYKTRMAYELSVIKSMGFSGYFLIVSDFVKWAKNNDIPVGPGRGSGAGSLVGWSLFITDLDPVEYTLIFERFLNSERISMPDFDIDFCQERRDEVIEYVKEKYGADKVAHIIALGKLQARAVLRDVGRVIQMPYNKVDHISKLIPQNPVNPFDLKRALEFEPALRQMMEEDETVKFLIETGLKLEGLYRHASMHAAGIVIGSDSIDQLVPVYSDGETSTAITQFSMKYVEAAGLVKFDFLGLKTLSLIKMTCDNVKFYQGIDLNISNIDLHDKKTFAALCDVDVVGIFQLESIGMKDIVQKLMPDKLEDIIALVSLYRPGPMEDIPKYLARKHGKDPIVYLHPILEPILKNTYGVMVYQEQVLKIAQEMGGYTLAAADILRRAMGKKIKAEMEKQRKIFADGAKKKGVSDSVAKQVFALMEKFAGYGFNRSHAAPYALLSYQTSFLKTNFPREFYIAIMNIDIDSPDKISMFVQDAKTHHLDILLPDINQSSEVFVGEGARGIRYALGALKGSGVAAMREIVLERKKNGLFRDVYDFFKRTKALGVNKRQLEALIFCGAFDSLHKNRNQLFQSLSSLLSDIQDSSQKQMSLFPEYKVVELKNVSEMSDIDKIEKERVVIGFYLDRHPMDCYSELLQGERITRSKDFESCNSTPTIAGVLLSKQEKMSKKGKKYVFLHISDQDNAFEVTVFQELYTKVASILTVGKALLIKASLKIDGGKPKLSANDIQNIESVIKDEKIYLEIESAIDLDGLRSMIESFEDGGNAICFIVTSGIGQKTEIETSYKKNITLDNRRRLVSFAGVKVFDAS